MVVVYAGDKFSSGRTYFLVAGLEIGRGKRNTLKRNKTKNKKEKNEKGKKKNERNAKH